MDHCRLNDRSALLVVDVQERLFKKIDQAEWTCRSIERLMQGFQLLNLPVFVSEQVPDKLGPTIARLRQLLQGEPLPSKTSFSCCGDPEVEKRLLDLPVDSWVVVGIETHVCVLQTAMDLLARNKGVVVVADGVGSRSPFDKEVALADLRDAGARISTVETVLFELLGSASAPQFKAVQKLIL